MCCGHSEHYGHRPMYAGDKGECRHAEHHSHEAMRGFGGCKCHGSFPSKLEPFFRSKKKQIRMIEKLLEQRREEVQDLADFLDELQQEQ